MNEEKNENRILENIRGNKGLYLMPKCLYDCVLEDMDIDEIICLLSYAEEYNKCYNANRQRFTTTINKEEIFSRVLETKDIDFVYIVLCFHPEFQNMAIEFLINCDDEKFIYEFIYAIDLDWNPEPLFSFLKNQEYLDDMVLWYKVVRKNELNPKNMMELLKDQKWCTLKVMWLINNKIELSQSQKDAINYYLSIR